MLPSDTEADGYELSHPANIETKTIALTQVYSGGYPPPPPPTQSTTRKLIIGARLRLTQTVVLRIILPMEETLFSARSFLTFTYPLSKEATSQLYF